MVSASSSTSSPLSEKDLPPLFLLRRLLRFLLGGLFLGLRFCCLFLLGRFLLSRFFGRGVSSSASSATITSSSSPVSTVSSVSPANSSSSSSLDSSLSSSKLSFSISIPSSPGGIFGPRLQRGSTGRCSGRSYLKFHPALEPLLPYSPGVVKHSAVFPARDLWDEGRRSEGHP